MPLQQCAQQELAFWRLAPIAVTLLSILLAALALRDPDFVCCVPAKILSWVGAYSCFAVSRVLTREELEVTSRIGWYSFPAPMGGAHPTASALANGGPVSPQQSVPLTGWPGRAAAA